MNGRPHTRRILVVEDDPELRELIGFVLRRDDYVVEEAADGAAGLAKMRQDLPDLVLLDLAMPVLDGRGFLAERQRDPALARVPVVIMSADSSNVWAARQEFSIPVVLHKPFTMASLRAVVGQCVQRDVPPVPTRPESHLPRHVAQP